MHCQIPTLSFLNANFPMHTPNSFLYLKLLLHTGPRNNSFLYIFYLLIFGDSSIGNALAYPAAMTYSKSPSSLNSWSENKLFVSFVAYCTLIMSFYRRDSAILNHFSCCSIALLSLIILFTSLFWFKNVDAAPNALIVPIIQRPNDYRQRVYLWESLAVMKESWKIKNLFFKLKITKSQKLASMYFLVHGFFSSNNASVAVDLQKYLYPRSNLKILIQSWIIMKVTWRCKYGTNSYF